MSPPDLRRFLGLAVAAALTTPQLFAHEREFTQSRDWFLPYAGEFELESRNFFDTSTGLYSGEVEFEWGITKHFAIEPGFAYREAEGGVMELEAATIEARFNFLDFEYGKWLPAMNLEYEQAAHAEDDANHGEVKFVLSRYGENGVDFTANVNIGREINKGKEWESEATLGILSPFTDAAPNLGKAGWREVPRIGLEATEDLREHFFQVGPLFVYRVSEHLNFLANYLFATNFREQGNTDKLSLILEWEF